MMVTTMKRWRKPILLTLLFLLAGAVVNVAVAWGCAIWATIPEMLYSGYFLPGDNRLDRIKSFGPARAWPQYCIALGLAEDDSRTVQIEGVAPGVTRIEMACGLLAGSDSVSGERRWRSGVRLVQCRFGWPLRCLLYEERPEALFVRPRSIVPREEMARRVLVAMLDATEGLRSGLPVRDSLTAILGASNRRLPVVPLMSAFLFNSALFAALLSSLAAGTASARPRWRRKRGQCPRCGYSLRGNPAAGVCPECGRGADSSSTAPTAAIRKPRLAGDVQP